MNSSPTTDNSVAARPVVLPANQPRQFYQGGKAIAALRGAESAAQYGPEDWVASTTPRFGKETDGLSTLPDGRFLRDAVTAAPEEWLGAEHVATFGTSTALLVKLLDAGQRLPVHLHPSNKFAEEHFGSHFGKTEAWAVIGTTGAEPTVHIGFREDIDAGELANWVDIQDREAMLGSLNKITVAPGDSVLIPSGLPHAIGAGVFIVELQQPTDFSITLEWQGFLDDAKAGHLGIGFDTALGAVDRSGWDADRLESIVRHTGGSADPVVPLLNSGAAPFFRADRLQVNAPVELDPAFSVLVALEGSGKLSTEHGGVLELRKGDTAVVPHAAGSSTVDGNLIMVRCRPPAPDTQGDS
jgi:mannose-6-phosphate isomerase